MMAAGYGRGRKGINLRRGRGFYSISANKRLPTGRSKK
jgi:hypothetical protein